MTAYTVTLMLHLGLGVLALGSYWTAALARKGSAPHKLAGKVYLLTMLGLLVPAVPLSARIGLKSPAFGVFLFYLILITLTALWQGWFASRHKREFARYVGAGFRRLAWANIGAGAAVLVLGVAQVNPVFMGFSLVGVLGGAGMLRLARRGPGQPRWWLAEHYGAMLGAGVATHIAFLSIGLPHLLPGLPRDVLQNVAWLGPLLLAGVARVWLNRRYRAPTIRPVSTTAPAGRGVPA